jgi:hypothetical protein
VGGWGDLGAGSGSENGGDSGICANRCGLAPVPADLCHQRNARRAEAPSIAFRSAPGGMIIGFAAAAATPAQSHYCAR